MKKKVLYAVIILAVIGSFLDNGEEKKSSKNETVQIAPVTASEMASTKPELPKYEVVDSDRYDAPIKTQIELHAVLSGKITEPGMKQLLDKLYNEANATKGFKNNNGKPSHVFIYLYTTQDHYKSGMGQWIAMLSKIGEDGRVDKKVKTEMIAQLNAKPELKYGLTESKRKEVFKALVGVEDRADAEANRLHPIPDPSKPGYSDKKVKSQIVKQSETREILNKKYISDVASQYGISEKQIQEISVEGVINNWPM